MSPASQGNLDVEHYTGSNLISARVVPKGKKSDGKPNRPSQHNHQRHVPVHSYPQTNIVSAQDCGGYKHGQRTNGFCHHGGTWTGVPLIAVANHRRNNHGRGPPRNTAVEDRTPLSRLAIHTQGAPLILSGRYSNSNRKNHGRQANRSNKYKDGSNGPTDCLSIASDESSGSGHSENCLPRIIKPRKRRKKDRKPSGPEVPKNDDNEESGNQNVVAVKPFVPMCYEQRTDTKFKKNLYQVHKQKPGPQPVASTSATKEEKGADDQHDPNLTHKFEDVKDSEEPSAPVSCSPSSCQCRYCDPSGIWDAPPEPFLAPPPPVFLTPPPDTKSFRFFDYPSSVKDHAELVLRRSWSEPTRRSQLGYGSWRSEDAREPQPRSNSFSESTAVGENSRWKTASCDSAGERQWESLKGCDINTKSESESVRSVNSLFNNVTYENLGLQVSTEIVTSLNGHRDLEIKFFSSSPSDSLVVQN